MVASMLLVVADRAGRGGQTASDGSKTTLLIAGGGLLLGYLRQLSSKTPDLRLKD